jgi:hypothetical protein
MSAILPARCGADDEIEVRFTVRQMMIAIAVVGIVMALLVRIPILGGLVLNASLLGFGLYKLSKVPLRVRLSIEIAIAVALLALSVWVW